MGSDSGRTTEAEALSPRRGETEARELALKWLFPRPDEPAVVLPGEDQSDRVIGRDDSCDVRLASSDVSRRHAALRSGGPGRPVEIADLGSRNGIRVNGRQVATAPLHAGDVVRVGGWVAVVTDAPGEFKQIAPGLLGGPTLQRALAPMGRAAGTMLPIVLGGETGTGKEVVTRAIHAWSRRPGPLVAVNCAALPEALAEAELFGYRRGAFTGAERASVGFFRGAEGGTLLLDEISELPLPLQAKLLRVLEEKEVQGLGEARPVPIDVRIVAAGQQPLTEVVRQGRFRGDLLARLDGLTVRLPPLRERREDVPRLFSYFLNDLTQGQVPAIEHDLIERLCLHDWPFNVRELVLLVRRLIALHDAASTLRATDLPARMGAVAEHPVVQPKGAPEPVELPALVAALRAAGGNVARAAATLGITRQRAYRLMEGQAIDLENLRKDVNGEPPNSERRGEPNDPEPNGGEPG